MGKKKLSVSRGRAKQKRGVVKVAKLAAKRLPSMQDLTPGGIGIEETIQRYLDAALKQIDSGARERALALLNPVDEETAPQPDYQDAGDQPWVSSNEFGNKSIDPLTDLRVHVNTLFAAVESLRDSQKQQREAIQQLQESKFNGRSARF